MLRSYRMKQICSKLCFPVVCLVGFMNTTYSITCFLILHNTLLTRNTINHFPKSSIVTRLGDLETWIVRLVRFVLVHRIRSQQSCSHIHWHTLSVWRVKYNIRRGSMCGLKCKLENLKTTFDFTPWCKQRWRQGCPHLTNAKWKTQQRRYVRIVNPAVLDGLWTWFLILKQ